MSIVHFSSQHWIHWMMGVCCMTLYTAVIMQMSEFMHVARKVMQWDVMGSTCKYKRIQTPILYVLWPSTI